MVVSQLRHASLRGYSAFKMRAPNENTYKQLQQRLAYNRYNDAQRFSCDLIIVCQKARPPSLIATTLLNNQGQTEATATLFKKKTGGASLQTLLLNY